MKQIVNGSTVNIYFLVLLIEKQGINFINSNIYKIRCLHREHEVLEEIILAKQRLGAEENMCYKQNNYKRFSMLYFFGFCILLI